MVLRRMETHLEKIFVNIYRKLENQKYDILLALFVRFQSIDAVGLVDRCDRANTLSVYLLLL